ncbi:MAG: lipopolysaccharide heptosyltransferase II [Candidatus Omnitrophica bacterium]|nr:lipopolysaccharide heptosyltransferase II [Candidatus Omnitrophota bacterium]
MQRILIVNVNWRGDVLFSTPFIRAVREKYPDSFIACVVVPRCVSIMENNPRLNEVIIFDEEAKHKGPLGKLRFINSLRSKHFDVAFLLHRSFTRTLICYLAGIPERIGYYTKKRAMLLTKNIAQPIEQLHKVEYFLNIAKACDIKTENKDYEFFLSQKDKAYIDSLFKENGLKESDFLVVINPGGNWDLKRWPKENFAQAADKLIKDYKAKVIITGAKSDANLARDIAALMKESPVIFCGRTSLRQLAALMAKVNLVVSNDSGPMHIAVSQGTKVISLFGPTSAKITGAYGKGNYLIIQKDVGCKVPCYKLDCDDNRCMKAITVEDVLGAI